MTNLNKILLLIIVTVFMSMVLKAQDIISAKDAGKMINNDKVLIVSAMSPTDFEKVHVPGAININHTDLYGEMSMLKPAAELGKFLGEKGIDPSKKIIIYDDGSMKYSGRLYWIFNYLGANDVKVIDGGMKAWRMARQPVTRNPSNPVKATFTPKINNNIYASMNLVKKAQNDQNTVIVDVRTPAEYKGTDPGKLRPGHIPSAINLNYENILNSDGTLKSSSELATIFKNAGVASNKTIILYCGTSVRAGIVFLALKGLNYPNIKVYDGAYTEWQSVASNVVTSF